MHKMFNHTSYIFKRLSDAQVVDLASYLKEKEAIGNRIYIGCDSQNIGEWTHYALAIVIHKNKQGGHVLYHKYKVPRIKNTFNRLWMEVDESIRLASYLKEQHIAIADYIDIDLNPDPLYKSNTVFRAALGYVTSMGFKARFKPNAHAASSCADYVLH